MSPQTLLLVDDEPFLTECIVRCLRRPLKALGVEIKAFNDPRELLKEIEANGLPTAVLTDDRMPGLPGRELAKQLRARGFAGRILMLSGTADESVYACGVDWLMTKPFENAKLVETIVALFSPPAAPAA